MKRFFYTTAAVVAFAFSGMANTIEMERNFTNQVRQKEFASNSILIEKKNSPNYLQCQNEANQARNTAILNGNSEGANQIYYQTLFSCLNRLSKDLGKQPPSLQP